MNEDVNDWNFPNSFVTQYRAVLIAYTVVHIIIPEISSVYRYRFVSSMFVLSKWQFCLALLMRWRAEVPQCAHFPTDICSVIQECEIMWDTSARWERHTLSLERNKHGHNNSALSWDSGNKTPRQICSCSLIPLLTFGLKALKFLLSSIDTDRQTVLQSQQI